MKIKCPHCGNSYYQQHYSTSTAMGWIQTYKNGVPQNDNPNITTTYCTCIECGHDFHYTEQYGTVQEIIDDGKKPEVPVLEVPLNGSLEDREWTVSSKDVLFIPEQQNECVRIVTEEDMNEVRQAVKELAEEVKGLKEIIYANSRVAKKKVVSTSLDSCIQR